MYVCMCGYGVPLTLNHRSTCCGLVYWSTIRGFERSKGDRVLGYNIIVVANRRYGLKRRSGMTLLGSILDLNVGPLQ
jgi:hypothetical protein